MAASNALSTYEMQKASGVRLPTGALKLKQLAPIHYTIIAMHLSGASNGDIADVIKKKAITVCRVLNDPLAISIIEECYKGQDARFKALYGKAIDVVDDSMTHTQPMNMRLKGANTYFKAHGKFANDEETGRESAEDVIARILQMNIQINIDTNKDDNSHILTQDK